MVRAFASLLLKILSERLTCEFLAFPARNGSEHRTLAEEYSRLETKEARDAFCKEHGVRDSELNQLPYWNPVRMAIIDPMHNIFLGMLSFALHHIYRIY